MNKKFRGTRITIFGSALPFEGDREYEVAYNLGRLLTLNGFEIVSGGAEGTMDAISKAAFDNGAEIITGVTLKQFADCTNKYVNNNIECDELFVRIEKLMELGDAYVVLPGGTGTLLELSAVWEYINKGFSEHKSIVCIGDFWKPLVDLVDNRMIFEGRNTGLVKLAKNETEAVKFLINIFENVSN